MVGRRLRMRKKARSTQLVTAPEVGRSYYQRTLGGIAVTWDRCANGLIVPAIRTLGPKTRVRVVRAAHSGGFYITAVVKPTSWYFGVEFSISAAEVAAGIFKYT